jgi:endoglycosylceramidase
MTDAGGRAVVLHGVNMVYKRPPYHAGAVEFDAEDAAFLESIGFNAVRVGVIYAAVEPQPGVYDDAYIEKIAETVDLLAQHGIHSQIDFHQDLYSERFQGEGFPPWAVQDDGLPAQPQTGFPGNYVVMPALWRAFDHFWANDPGPGGVGLQDRYAAAWRHVAQRFAGHPFVMGYDVINEPWPGSVWPTCANPIGCPVFEAGPLSDLTDRVLDAIREVDPDNIVWYEPQVIFNFGAQTHHRDTGDPAAGFSFHNYCLFAGVVPGASTPNPPQDDLCGPLERDYNFANAEAHSARTGDALLLSEFGATDDLDLLRRMVDGADSYRLNWLYWHYCPCDDPTTSGVGDTQAIVYDPAQPPEGANLKQAKLDVLVRPYPQVVSGTPEGWSFERATKAFTLAYSTTGPDGRAFGAGAETEVFVPVRQYPGGYDVTVEGAQVVSQAGEQVLRLAAGAGATRVSVRVVPSPSA